MYGKCSHCEKLASENESLRSKLQDIEDMNKQVFDSIHKCFVTLQLI